jgi:hypothetical protein
MTEEYPTSEKVYPTENLGRLSIIDMLAYFEEKDAMRASDLHIKIGAPPTYRIDVYLVNPATSKHTPMQKHLSNPALRFRLSALSF